MSTKATIAWVDEVGPDGNPIRGVHVYRDMAEARPQRVHVEVYGEEGTVSVALTEESWEALRRQLPDRRHVKEMLVQPIITGVRFIGQRMVVDLEDGRELVVLLARFPSIASATPEQRSNWRLVGGGIGIHWPDLDEDISVAALLSAPNRAVRPAPEDEAQVRADIEAAERDPGRALTPEELRRLEWPEDETDRALRDEVISRLGEDANQEDDD